MGSDREGRAILAMLDEVVVQYSVDGVVQWASPSLTTVLGHTIDDVVGTRFQLPQVSRHRQHIPATRADGTQVWLDAVLRPLHDESGALIGSVLLARDLSGEMNSTTIAAERQALRATLDASLDPCVLLSPIRDDNGTVIDLAYADANDAACAYNGLTRDELLATTVLTLLPGLAAQGLFAKYVAVVEDGQPLVLDDVVFEHELIAVPRHLDVRGVKVGDAVALTWRDITDRAAATERTARSEARLSLILDTMGEGVVIHGPDGRIVDANRAAHEITGLSAEQMHAQPVVHARYPLLRPDGSPMPAEEHPVHLALTTGEAIRGSVLGVRMPDDHVTWIQVNAEPLTGDDGTSVVSTFTDITEKVEADRALRDSERRFRLLAVNASEVVLQTGPDHRIEWASPSIEQVLGYAPSDVLGKAVSDLLDPAEVERLRAEMAANIEQGRPGGERQMRFVTADGGHRWMSALGHAVRDEAGALIGGVDALRDIQEEVEARTRLAASEARLQMLLDSIAEGVVVCDAEGAITECNPAALSILGVQRTEIVGAVSPAAEWPTIREDGSPLPASEHPLSVALVTGESVHDVVMGFRRADDQVSWLLVNAEVLHGDDGAVSGAVTTFTDITARVTADQQLREAEARYRLLAENASDFVMLADTEGAIEWVSPSIAATLGWRPEDVLGMTPADLVHPDDSAQVAEWESAAREGQPSTHRVRMRDTGGGYRWFIRTAKAVRTEEGHLRGRVAGYRDIQSEVEAQQRLSASERQYRLLAENATDFVVLVNLDGTLGWASPSVQRVLGWDPEAVVGLTVQQFVHSDDLAALARQQRNVSAGEPAVHRFRIQTSDGEWRWFLAASKAVRDESGTVVGRVTGFQDVDAEVRAREELHAAHERLELVLSSSRLGLWDWNLQTGEVVFNERWAEIVGYRLAELEPISIDTWAQLAHPEDLVKSEERIAAHAAGQTDFYDLDCRMRHRDGHWVWVRDRGRIVAWDDEGRPLRMTGTHEDISVLKRATDALEASEKRFRAAMASAPVAMAIVDLERRITQVNPALCALVGRDEQLLLGRGVADLLDGPGDLLDRRARVRLLHTPDQALTLEHAMVRSDGSHLWVQQSVNLVYGAQGEVTGYVSQFADITEAREARHRLRDLAARDPLTDLLNRRELPRRMQDLLARDPELDSEVAVLFIDLDGLKQINDTYGHLVGDEVIQQVARRVLEVVSRDDLVVRYGGDEFVVIVTDVREVGDAQRIAERIHEGTRAPMRVGDVVVPVTCSIGIATTGPDCAPDSLLARADAAVYRAKREGRNRTVVHDPRWDD